MSDTIKTPPFIIFLDIDGVFNCELFFKERHRRWLKDGFPKEATLDEHHINQLCTERISWFNDLVKEINALVVVSSTWRGMGVDALQKVFDNVGGTFKVHDVTPYCSLDCCRGDEIKKWIKDNIIKEVYGINYYDFYKYAIIDDDSDMLLNQANNFFHTDGYSGLTPNTCYKIKRFATHETF